MMKAPKNNASQPEKNSEANEPTNKGSLLQKSRNVMKHVAATARASKGMHEIHSALDAGSLELSNALIKGEVAPMYGGGSFPEVKEESASKTNDSTHTKQAKGQTKEPTVTSHGAPSKPELGVVDEIMQSHDPSHQPDSVQQENTTSHENTHDLGVVDRVMVDLDATIEQQEPEIEQER